MRVRVGVIADTHGLLRPEALAALAGSDHIVHAGDIGAPQILETLAVIAPVTAVRGNNDVGAWAAALPQTASLTIAEVSIFVLHDVGALGGDARAAGHAVVIAGHSHCPRIATVAGVLHFNPGSAGPRRFSLPVAIGHLDIVAGRASARIEALSIGMTKVVRARRSRR